jgi:hypothetical protein
MERRPWLLAGPPFTLGGIGVAVRIHAAGQGRPMNPTWEVRMAWVIWAVSVVWIIGVVVAWWRDRRRIAAAKRAAFAPRGWSSATPQMLGLAMIDEPTRAALDKESEEQRCSRCAWDGNKWFSDLFGDERICRHCADGMPYPRPGETEEDYVARWKKDGKPRS